MSWLTRFRRDELKDEIRIHREMLEEQFVHEGMTRGEAQVAARRRFGNEAGALEQSRDEWGFAWVGAIFRDLRFACRLLRKQPMLVATVILVSGLGVGANTAIVSVLETVMLKPLGLRDSERVMVASVRIDKIKLDHAETSGAEYQDLRAMTDVFQSFAAAEGRWWTFRAGEEAIRLRGEAVTADFFRVFRERPQLGRFFTPEDRDTLVLSWRFWKTQYGGDPNIVGRKVVLDGVTYRVVGVAEERFRYPASADAWSSLDLPLDRLTRRGYNMTLTLLGHLGDQVTPAQAARKVNGYVAALKSSPEGREMDEYQYFIDLAPFARYIAGDLRRPLWLLWAAALAVLFTACANIAVLLLSRTAGRRREIAIRLSLGATRFQILRQFGVESLLLGLMGGAFGIAISAFALTFVGRVAIPGKQMLELVTLDWRLMLYGMALSLVSGAVFGLAPAIQLLRSSQSAALTRSARHRFQHVFIAGQIAAALVLLIATGLLLRSLWTIESIRPGFEPAGLTTALIMRPAGDPAFLDRLQSRMHSSPAIEASAVAYPLPFSGGGLTSGFAIQGRPQPASGMAWHGEAWFVSPEYLSTLRIPLLRGRGILDTDGPSAPSVCLIDRKFAERFFANEEPIGRVIDMYGRARIVGVVEDVRSSALEHESRASVYYSIAQQTAFPTRGIIVKSRTAGAALIRDLVRQANGSVPVFDIRTMQERIAESLGIRQVLATLVSVFAGICILLAAIGLHGVVTQVVSERSSEIAVRMALGARQEQIFGQFLREGLAAGMAGIAGGALAAVYAQRGLQSFLFDARPFDAETFGAACCGLTAVLAIAVVRPARRAARTEPQTLLRHE